MMKKLISAAAIAALTVSSAYATTQTNLTIKSVGFQGGVGYLTVNEVLTTTCAYSVLYLPDLGTTNGKGLYSQLLTALSSGLPLARVDYTADPVGPPVNKCTVSLIAL